MTESQPTPPLQGVARHWSLLGFFKLPKLSQTLKKSPALSPFDVAGLLRKYPPTLLTCQDTVIDDGTRKVVHYSLDTVVQKCGKKLLARYHPKYGAVVALDPATGGVKALISYTREGETPLGNNLYCKSIFPAASVFKTITAAGAIEKAKVNPESTFALAGRRYTLYKFQLAPNLPYSQDVSLEDAYSMSINPIFGRIGIYVLGVAGLREYMRKFGFNEPIPFDLDNETPVANETIPDSLLTIAETASGFNRVTRISPLFGALIAAAVAQKGVMPVPTLVDSITVPDSGAMYKVRPRALRIPIKEGTAATLKDLMARVVNRGTARKSFTYARRSSCFNDVEYGGKTGSVDDEKLGKIDWFIGFARSNEDARLRMSVGVVTVHDEFWTVHSSSIGEELFRVYFKGNRAQTKVKYREEPDTTEEGNEDNE
jgi:cell division protein FtsI/penicillin-binding protein 2